MATVNGTPVNFTFGTVAIAITNITGALFQTISYKKGTDRKLVKNQSGDRVTSAHADLVLTSTLKWKVTGSSMAVAITNTTLNAPGAYVIITACAALPDIVHATDKWEVLSGEVAHSNEDVAEITLEIEKAAGITAFPAA